MEDDLIVCKPLYVYFQQHSDMNEEMRTETMELCVTACEKFSSNNEVGKTNISFLQKM